MKSRSLLLLVALAARPALAEPRPVGGVVAVVEGQPITAYQVRLRAAPALAQIRAWTVPQWRKEAQRREALSKTLEAMIEDELLLRAARQARLSLPTAGDEALDQMAAQFGWDRARLLAQWEMQWYTRERLLQDTQRHWLRQIVLRDAWQRERPADDARAEPPEDWSSRWIESLKRRATIERRLPS